MLNVTLQELSTLVDAFTEWPDSNTNLPVVAETASLAGIAKSFNSSVVVAEKKCDTVTVFEDVVTLLTCAIRTIDVYPGGAT